MKKSVFACGCSTAITLLLALSACTTTGDGGIKPFSGGLCSTPKQHCINVYVVGNKMVVDVDTLYVYGPNHMIYWQIDPDTGAGYTFPGNGIAIAGSDFNCQAIQGGAVFFCRDQNSMAGAYKYTINLTGPQQLTPLDPWIRNG
jgi:hypothetical protein